MNSKNVLVLFGGTSPEHEISKESAVSVINALKNHNVVPVYITREGKWLLYDGKPENIGSIDWERFGTTAVLSPDKANKGLLRIVNDKVKRVPIDIVFPVLHGPGGEDGTIQGLCELAGIPYVGCGVVASSVAMDKATTKLIAKALKIPQADFITFEKQEIKNELETVLKKIRYKIAYPCFIKPSQGGSSIGISKVNNKKELIIALETAAKFSSKVVVEKGLTNAREIEVGILGNGKTAKVSIPGEIIADGEFYDYDAKYIKPESKTIVPTDLPEDLVSKIQKYALDIFSAINGKGLSRVDFFVTKEGKIIFNEINTMPGFTKISMYSKVFKAEGLSQQDIIENLLELALTNE